MTNRKSMFILTLIGCLFFAGAGFAEEKAKPANAPMVGKFGKVDGSVEVQKFGQQQWIQAKEGMEIGSGDQVASGIDGKAQIIFANSKTDVEPLAQFAVGRNFESKEQYSTEIFLQVGKIKSDVDKNSGKMNKFTITTPSSVCGIRGTTVESAFVPGVGAINTITDGAGYVAPVQADKLPPAIQQILNVPPSVEACEAAAKAAEKAGAPAAVVAAIAAGAAPTEEARAVMAQIAVAGGASAAAAAAIEQGFGSFASIASSLTIPDAPSVGADVAPISAGPAGAPAPGAEPAAGGPAGAPGLAPAPGAEPAAGGPAGAPAPGAEPPAATGMEALVAAFAGGAFGGAPGGGPAGGPGGEGPMPAFAIPGFTFGGGPAGEPGAAGNMMEGMAALMATMPGLFSAGGPEVGGGFGPPGGPGEPGRPAGEPGVPGGPGGPVGEPGAPGGPGGPGGPSPFDLGAFGGGPSPFDAIFAGAFGQIVDVANGQGAYTPHDVVFTPGGGGPDFGPMILSPAGPEGGPGGGPTFGPGGPIFGPDGPVFGPGGPIFGPGGPGEFLPFLADLGPIEIDLNVLIGSLIDRDHDGIPNDWELANGLNPDDPTDAGQDGDRDGYPNIMEFGAGTKPADATSKPSVTIVGGVSFVNLPGIGLVPLSTVVSDFFTASLGLSSTGFSASSVNPDQDADGIYDEWERAFGLNPADPTDAASDLDGDGYTNLSEFQGHSAPTISGSVPYASSVTFLDDDNDGMPNDWEIANGLNPNFPDGLGDNDNDGWENVDEFFGGSNPQSITSVPSLTNNDPDGDGMATSWEISFGFDPNVADGSTDFDGDGYSNLSEFQNGTLPKNSASNPGSSMTPPPDDDLDEMPNNWEVAKGLSPSVPNAGGDADLDGYTNLNEFLRNSEPNNAGSKPTNSVPDQDMDGLPNWFEVKYGFNPNTPPNPDGTPNLADATGNADGDPHTNLFEYEQGSNPKAVSGPGAQPSPTNSDGTSNPPTGDPMPDFWEQFYGFNVEAAGDANGDADMDGYSNLEEYLTKSDPKNKFVTPAMSPQDHGMIKPGMTSVRDNTFGAFFEEHTDGFKKYFTPDRPATWAYHPSVMHSGYGGGYLYVNAEASPIPTELRDMSGPYNGLANIVDGDGDGHSPQAAFMGTVFHDANDASFTTPGPQHQHALDASADPTHSSWANNPNPFHH